MTNKKCLVANRSHRRLVSVRNSAYAPPLVVSVIAETQGRLSFPSPVHTSPMTKSGYMTASYRTLCTFESLLLLKRPRPKAGPSCMRSDFGRPFGFVFGDGSRHKQKQRHNACTFFLSLHVGRKKVAWNIRSCSKIQPYGEVASASLWLHLALNHIRRRIRPS